MFQIELKVGGTELAKVLHYYGLLEQGNEFKLVCPFHDDVNASLKVNLNDGSFYCFGCGATGNAMKFVQSVNTRLDDLQACIAYFKILRSKKVNKIAVKVSKEASHHIDKQAQIEASDYFSGLKKINWSKYEGDERDYLNARGLTSATLTKCNAKLTYNTSYPVIFPMNDLGKFRGWVCRTMSKEIEKKRKYLYNTGFSRRSTLVGDYAAKTVMLVEGYMDYLKMRQNGVSKVAAILGWKVTEQQITKLKAQGVVNIISALDSDVCGIKGTEYLKKFFNVIRFEFPEGVKDPGDLSKAQFKVSNENTKREYRRQQQ